MNLLFIVVLSLLALGYAMDPKEEEEEAVKVEDLEIRGWRTDCGKNPGSVCRRRQQGCGNDMEVCCEFKCGRNKICCCPKPTPTPTPTPEPSCPSGWTEFGSQCYFIKGKMNTFEGFYQCQKYGATLPIIKSAEENAFLLRLMEKHGQTRLGMIAPNRDNVFEWLDGTSVEDTFSAWNTGEPNYKGTENCGSLYVSGPKGKWNNDPCTTSLYIVCQMEKK